MAIKAGLGGLGDRGALGGRPAGVLRLLLTATILVPLTLFLFTAWVSYREHFDIARAQLGRMVDLGYEHAAKVFETHVLTAAYVNELLSDLSPEEIREREAVLHARLADLVANLRQIQDIWVLDASGHPVLTGRVFPAPRDVDLSDRQYFRVHRDGQVAPRAGFVTERLRGRVQNVIFFQISQRRAKPDGAFDGVIAISVDPGYFESFYAEIAKGEFGNVTLLRDDGAVLARFPRVGLDSLPAGSAFRRSIAAAPRAGSYEAASGIDGVSRLFAYKRMEQYPIYLSVGLDRAAVEAKWLASMGGHLLFGVPATLGLILLTVVALRRAGRESATLALLQAEVGRREATEAQLRQSQKMEAVGQLTGGIAHDFNNLLTVILGQAEMLRRRVSADAPRWVRNVEAIESAARRAATLTHRLLAFARRQPLAIDQVDVNRLVAGMSELLRRSLGESIEIETVLAGGLWPAHTDPNQLESAIVNLAVNARDAMPNGGRLTIETANAHIDGAYAAKEADDVEPGQYVLIAVSDTGTGMAEAVAARAFEPFFTTKDIGAGTGLGLSQVYGFVKQSSGHVKIYSEIGQGTTVKIYLPRGFAGAAPAEEPARNGTLPGGRETILVVEDEPAVRQHATASLAELGYAVVEAASAAEALQKLDGPAPFDLLFTDIGLPGGVNGRMLADAARQKRPDLPVLFTTGYTSNAVVHHGRLDPGVMLLTKPYSLPDLAERVRRAIDRKSGG